MIRLIGNWKKGWAVDLHTESSIYQGVNEFGHDRYETKRTEMGEYVYKLKYKSDLSVIPQIIEIIIKNIKGTDKITDAIVPVPPSKPRAHFKPVYEVAEALSKKTGVPFFKNAIIKQKKTPELKSITDPTKRQNALKDVFSLSPEIDFNNKKVLLIDDLFRSGATLKAITSILYYYGNVQDVYVLTLTKTRSNR